MNKIRRSMYGLMLGLSMPLAAAAPPAQAPLKPQAESARAAAQKLELNLGRQSLLLDVLNRDENAVSLAGELIPGYRQSQSDLPDVVLHRVLLSLEVDGDELKKLRTGLGANLVLPDFGRFHLTLYSRRGAELAGKRWELVAAGADTSAAKAQTWSLGSTLDWVRTPEDGERHVVMVPQLAMDLSQMLGAPGRLDAFLQLAHWHNVAGQTTSDEPLPQLTLRWKY